VYVRIGRKLARGEQLTEAERYTAAFALMFMRTPSARELAEHAAELMRTKGLTRKAAIVQAVDSLLGHGFDDPKGRAAVARALDRLTQRQNRRAVARKRSQ